MAFSAEVTTCRVRLQLALNPAAAREVPGGHDDGLALLVVERVLAEPCRDQVHQLPVAQRVGATRRHLDHGRFAGRLGPVAGGDGDDGGHHHVDGDHVDHALGDARKLLEQTRGRRR